MISRISFAGLYLFNVLLTYMLTGNYIAAVISAAVIPVILFIWQKVTLFKSGATHITKCRRSDAELLYSAYHEVEERAKSCGYKIRKSAKLYISDEDTHNAYNCGNAIVVNRPVLYGPELRAVLAHELNHYRCGHSYFSMLLGANFFIAGISLSLFSGLYLLLIIIFIVAILGIFTKNSGWFGLILAKLLIPLKRGFCNLIVTMLLAIEMGISRNEEYASDAFVVDTGYGEDLINFLSMDTSLRKPLTFTERLLSSHPSDLRRCAKIEHRLEKIYNEGNSSSVFPIPIE